MRHLMAVNSCLKLTAFFLGMLKSIQNVFFSLSWASPEGQFWEEKKRGKTFFASLHRRFSCLFSSLLKFHERKASSTPTKVWKIKANRVGTTTKNPWKVDPCFAFSWKIKGVTLLTKTAFSLGHLEKDKKVIFLAFIRKLCSFDLESSFFQVVVPKAKGEILGVVIVESGWGSMLPTIVLANLSPAGPAARCGQLNIGDQVKWKQEETNVSLRPGVNQSWICAKIKAISGPLKLKNLPKCPWNNRKSGKVWKAKVASCYHFPIVQLWKKLT